ncbi:hypothetical protein SUDANB150_07656 [Streptomyces sp. enrichment culture]
MGDGWILACIVWLGMSARLSVSNLSMHHFPIP